MSPKTATKKASKSKAKRATKPAAKKKVLPIPKGYPRVIPYMVVKDADLLAKFMEKVFGGKLKECMRTPDGTIMHAEFWIKDSVIMMGSANEKWPPRESTTYVYLEDVDAAYKRALAAGATSSMEPADQFYGDRSAGVVDSQGNTWWMGTHVEDVSPKEMAKRAAEYAGAC